MAEKIRGWCALCRSRCGCISVVKDGRLIAVEPDPSHPTGAALCIKGRAAPELVHHPDRLLHPLKRTRPKGDPDPGWVRIGWDEALDISAAGIRRLSEEHGPEGVAFAVTSPSGTALSDSIQWIERLIRAFGSPNTVYATEVCNWHKDFATRFTFGAGLPTPDYANTGCMLLWGFNPSTSWLAQAQAAAKARARGARLIVVDPRRAGLAAKADLWLRVRPGTDGALALGIAGVMIENGWYDRAFVSRWTNGPLLVRRDTGRFLRECDLMPGGSADRLVAWDESRSRPVVYDSRSRCYDDMDGSRLALSGELPMQTAEGTVVCEPAFGLYAALCRRFPPEAVEHITWVPAEQVLAAARLLHEARPISYYAWTGVGQHTNATQTDRAIALLYALTGCFDAPGGNVILDRPATADVSGWDLMPEAQWHKALGLARRPLGPPASGWVTAADFYTAVLDGDPYPVRGLVGFGANLILAHADGERGRRALEALAFFVHADLFLTPTSRFADVVLPVTTPWEREALRVGFEISAEAESLIQLRPRAVEPAGEARSDTEVVFALADRLGLGTHFWNGDIEAANRHRLGPSGVTLDDLKGSPSGVQVRCMTRHRKYEQAPGFVTPTGMVEIYSENLLAAGQSPLPSYIESAFSHSSRPDLAQMFPLVLTSSKTPHFCHSQHRAIPSLRRGVPHPIVEIHPDAATARDIGDGDRVEIRTPKGRASMVARFNTALDPRVVSAQHGWWQACPELGLPGYDPFGSDGANYNLLIGNDVIDPVSGSVPHRSYLCQVIRHEDG
ncbi:molybdopterin-dependent oxidoreductase [Rhodospirillaceae bacterium SYSU D60014]|uniref:molybdopterin-containing oxidoreductase family protein n=1 Tax=Virgifigura deserti TaxID=2268457 RepID=UPI000E67417A